MISIRKYLDLKFGGGNGGGASPDAGFHGSLAQLATVLLSEIGAECQAESGSVLRSYCASIEDIRQRLEAAESAQDVDVLSAEIPPILEEFRRNRQEIDRRQAVEVQKMVALLRQTIEALAAGSDRSISRLRNIEADIRAATQISEIVALKERLNSCVEQIRDGAATEKREFVLARSRIERDFEVVQERAAMARGGVPGRTQAEQRLAEAGGRSAFVAVLLERQPAIKARYGAGVAERYVSAFIDELTERLPSPKKVFRWNEQSVLVELPAGGAGIEADVRSRLAGIPRAAQIDVGGRVAALENLHRWCLAPAGSARQVVLQRVENFVKA